MPKTSKEEDRSAKAQDQEALGTQNGAPSTSKTEDVSNKEESADGAEGSRREENGDEAKELVDRDDDDDDNGCSFCKFMKGGGCREIFVAWEKCVDAHQDTSGEDFTTACYKYTQRLQECMEKEENREYYMPMLEEEAAYAEQHAADLADEGSGGDEGGGGDAGQASKK